VTLSRWPRLGRFVIVNHFKRVADAVAPTTKYPKLKAFLSSNIFSWIWSYLRLVFERKHPFQSYSNPGKNGVYRVLPTAGSDVRIGLAGDWATGTDEAHQIALLMEQRKPDFTIHLGDVYYVGDKDEIEENCLGQAANGYTGVVWPKGTQGSFALNGNHEMYANGKPYFQVFRKELGMKGDAEGQRASFFCLEIEGWRILAIDTGYNSVGLPILGMIPGLREIPFIGGDCRLEQKLLQWLRDTVRPVQNPKPTVLLSHHQHFSSFPEQNYPKPARQLAEFFAGREIVWLWGHVHRLGIYEKFTTPENLTFYARCVGHGGMPIELAIPGRAKAPLALYDTRSHALDDGSEVGQNGYVEATIRGDVLRLEYRDIDNVSLLAETFRPGAAGKLAHEWQDSGILKSAAG
jgi:hypothetical protein